MNNFFKELSESLNPNVIQEIVKTNYDARVKIKEDNPNSNSKDFYITGLHKDFTIVLKLEKVMCINHSRTNCITRSPLFNHNKEHLCECCDYLIITSYKEEVYCFFLENKTNNHDNRKIKRQLQKTKHLWDYLMQLLKYYCIDYEVERIKYFYILSSFRYCSHKQYKKHSNTKIKVFGNIEVKPIPQFNTNLSSIISL